jgi:hypothetical protein
VLRQGCTLPPGLLNIHSKYIIRGAWLDDIKPGVGIGGRKINNLKYANDIILLAVSKEDMVELIKSGKNESERAVSNQT